MCRPWAVGFVALIEGQRAIICGLGKIAGLTVISSYLFAPRPQPSPFIVIS